MIHASETREADAFIPYFPGGHVSVHAVTCDTCPTLVPNFPFGQMPVQPSDKEVAPIFCPYLPELHFSHFSRLYAAVRYEPAV